MSILETSFAGRFSADAGHLADLLTQAVVEIHSPRGGGAGLIWGDSGLVLTNAHCVPHRAQVGIVSGGRTHCADVIAYARDHDLAVVHAPALRGPLLELRDERTLRPAEIVFAHGHPFGMSHSLTMGAIHSVATHPRTGKPRFIIAAVRLAPGNSGGPLVDAHGRLVGINSMVVGGLGVAIPALAAQEVVLGAMSRRAA